MNEYLRGADGGKRFGSPQFTDVFASAEQRSKYHDTPLSPLGLKQVRGLKQQRCLAFVQDCDLVVVSPLTRALQTFDMGLKGHFEQHESSRNVPVVALPEAAERLYLVSDLGRPVADLQPEFSYVDFETGFLNHDAKSWWYQREHSSEGTAEEWRPVGNGQRYGCASEPSVDFNFRMTRLHTWLHDRPEKHIAVVCHHGVINWMLAMDFDNCQYHTVPFDSVQPRALIRDNNEQTTAR